MCLFEKGSKLFSELNLYNVLPHWQLTELLFLSIIWLNVFFILLLQLYELDGDPKRKEFLDDLFNFMQKRGKCQSKWLYFIIPGLSYYLPSWREIQTCIGIPTYTSF